MKNLNTMNIENNTNATNEAERLNIEHMASFETIYKELQKANFMKFKRSQGFNIKTVGLCDLGHVFFDILYKHLRNCYTTKEQAKNDFMIRLNIGNMRNNLPTAQFNNKINNVKHKDFLLEKYNSFIDNFF